MNFIVAILSVLLFYSACVPPATSPRQEIREVPRQAKPGTILERKDRFTGEESVMLFDMEVPVCDAKHDEQMRQLQRVTARPLRNERPTKKVDGCGNWTFGAVGAPASDTAVLLLMHSHEEWWWMDCHPVDMLVDNNPMRPASVDWKGDTKMGGVIETVAMTFERPQLEALFHAQTLDIRVCHSEMRFEPENLAGLRDFITRILSISSPPATDP